MANRQPQRQTLAAAVFAACLTMSIAAQAQEADADAQPAASEDQPTTLATMTVTAQKREEALQDVPISVTVLDQQLIQDTGVYDIKDLQVLVPGLTVTSTQSEAITTARIRGIGSRSEEHTSELQSLMRTSYAVFCLKKKKHTT